MNIAATKMFFKELLSHSSRQFLTGFLFDIITSTSYNKKTVSLPKLVEGP